MRLSKPRKEMVTTMMRDAIFESALAVLQKHNAHEMTMGRIAAEAETTKSSLYHYFRSKNDLLDFMHARIVEPIAQMIGQITQADLAAPAKLEKILEFLLQSFREVGSAFGILTRDKTVQSEMSSLRRRKQVFAIEQFTAIFEQGIKEGAFRAHDPGHSARMFTACILDLSDIQAAGGSIEAANSYAKTMMHVFLNGLSVKSYDNCGSVETDEVLATLTMAAKSC